MSQLELTLVAEGLQFPEGPIAMADGSVVLVEIERGTLTRVAPDGTQSIIAKVGGGPNGAAIGPDGAVYLCNNGGSFTYFQMEGINVPGPTPSDHKGGSIQRVDPKTGEVKTLWVGDLVSAPSRRASSCPARQPPIFWFQPGFLAKRRVLSNSDAASDARGRSLRRRAGNTGSGNFEIFSTFSPGFASRNER